MHPDSGKTSMTDNFLSKLLRKVNLVVSTLELPDLSTLAKVVFAELLLAFHNTGNGRCDPSAKTIGKRVDRDEKNVRGAIGELEAASLLRSRRQGPRAPAYSFPGLDDLYRQPEDRAKSPGLITEDRANSSKRPGENASRDRAKLPDKPSKRTNKENHPSLRSGGSRQTVRRSTKKATRISERWQPSPASREFALSRGLTASQVDDEAIIFRNHWIEKPGSGAKKLDWDKPFQSWIIRAVRWGNERRPEQRPIDRSTIDWDWYVNRYALNGAWMPTLGPAPDHAGCKAPIEVLHRHGFGRSAAGAA
jgi:hypothetical protein